MKNVEPADMSKSVIISETVYPVTQSSQNVTLCEHRLSSHVAQDLQQSQRQMALHPLRSNPDVRWALHRDRLQRVTGKGNHL